MNAEEPPTDPEPRDLVARFGWLDRYGREREAEVYRERPPGRRVFVYAATDDGERQLVAGMTAEGKFYHLVQELALRSGLDTRAAWNDLFEVCRSAQPRRRLLY